MKEISEFQSKIIDGLVSATLIVVGAGFMIGLMNALKALGEVGVVVGLIMKFAVVGVLLKISLRSQFSEIQKAWLGVIGAMLAWTGLELAEVIELMGVDGLGAVHLFGLALILTIVFWKSLPIAGRFFSFIFLLNWGGHLVIEIQKHLAGPRGFLETSLTTYGWAMVPLIALTVYLIFEKTETRVKRLYFAGWLYLFLFTIIHLIFIH